MAKKQVILALFQLTLFFFGTPSRAEQHDLPGPILQIHGGGPTGHIASIRFAPGGNALYAGGWDKAVWVWRKEGDQFHLDPDATYRVPIGPGLEGAINSIAVSPDGRWLAVAGMGVFRGAAGFRDAGQMVPISAMEPAMRLDQGAIHVFNTQTRESYSLRGHEGEVVGMAFARGDGPPVLASAAREWNATAGKYQGAARLWNVQRRQAIGHLKLPVPDGPPGIVVQRDGAAGNAVSVSLAWWAGEAGSGVYYWDVARGRSRATSQPDYSRSLLTAGNSQISASFWRSQPTQPLTGVLRFWNRNGNQLVERPNQRVNLGGGLGRAIPSSLEVVRRNVLAITELGLIGNKFRVQEARLRLVQLRGNQQANTLHSVKLWDASDPPRLPIMDASRNGDYLAVAGSPHGGVRIYQTAQLLDGNQQPSQELRLPAMRFERIAFVTKDDDWGLRLHRDPNYPGDWDVGIFALEDHGFDLEQPDQWQDASADDARATVAAGEPPTHEQPRQTVELRDGSNSLTVRLPARYALNTAALANVNDDPVWAIAASRGGQPLLQLYDGRTGQPLRQLSGHQQRIRALTFSRDGQWLASIEDGPQVCIWSMDDLADARDDGGLPQIAVVKGDRPATLKVIEDGKHAVLQSGDVILGRLVDGQPRSWRSPREFHDTWWATRPGQSLTLRVERDGQTQDMAVTAEHGVDERKPLFSLLVTGSSARIDDLSWLAWSPLGAFDSSDRRVENLVGWHFNGEDEQPAAYAALHQYRSQYYRPFLTRELIRTLRVPPRPRPAAPGLSLRIPDSILDDAGRANRLVRDLPRTIQLIVDPSFPLDLIDSVVMRLNDEPAGVFQLQADRTWEAQLESIDVTTDLQRVRGVVQTNESPPREFPTELSFRMQPDAPVEVQPPPVPLATLLPLRKGNVQFVDSTVNVEVALDRPLKAGENISLRVNDRDVEAPLKIAPLPGKGAIASARISIDPAQENRVQVHTADETHRLVSEPLILPAAPPRVGKVRRTPIPDTMFQTLAIEVENHSPSSDVFVDEIQLPRSDYEFRQLGDGVGELLISRVALPKKPSRLRVGSAPPVEVASIDAAPVDKAPVEATADTPPTPVEPAFPPTPPDVRLLGPEVVTVADVDHYTVEFQVRSASPIERVDVYNGSLFHRDDKLQAEQDGEGNYVARKSVQLKLRSGMNNIEILARNAKGEGSARLDVTRPSYPMSVLVDGFSLQPRRQVQVEPTRAVNGRLTFPDPLPQGHVTLQGRVRWADANDPQLSRNRSIVHIWVNGFQQLPVRLAKAQPGSRERSFTADIVLNQAKANLIEIEALADEHSSIPRRFYVDCQQAIAKRRVHLLVVSVDQDDTDADALVDSAIEAFDGRYVERNQRGLFQGRFQTAVFEDGYVYGPLTSRNLTPRLLTSAVLSISRQIRTLQRTDPATDVILVYYRGAELINKPDGFYLTTVLTNEDDQELTRIVRDPVILEQFAVRSEQLNRMMETHPGAYVLLLDVARNTNLGNNEQANWPNDSRAAMLRYAWLNGLDVPEAARLLAGLRTAIPDVGPLREVRLKLEDNHALLRRAYPRSVSFFGYVPTILEDLAMGTGAGLVVSRGP